MDVSAPYPFGAPLTPTQLRVLGSLIEKEITTPEQYPLSLNALVNACNQRSSREPVLDLSDWDVRDALTALEDHALVNPIRDARVAKYEHRARTVLNLRRDETALICLLLLRGPQTPGELRSRADRLFAFDDLASVQSALDRLANRPVPDSGSASPQSGPLTKQLLRQPGSRESRYIHLLGEPPAASTPVLNTAVSTTGVPLVEPGRFEQLEAELASLRAETAKLTERVARLEAANSTPRSEHLIG